MSITLETSMMMMMMIIGLFFSATFVHMVGNMGRATYKGNEAKLKMKHSSDMPIPTFEHRCS